MARDTTSAWLFLSVAVVALVASVPAAGIAQPTDTAPLTAQTADVDYQISSTSELDYYNSRGFEDRNGDGRVVLELTTVLNMSQSRDPTLTYSGTDPLVIVGGGGFTEVPAPLIATVPDDSRLVLDSITITNVSADEHSDDVINVASPVTLTNVTITDTVHRDRYPTDTFEETHRVSVINAGGSVTVEDSEIANAGQAISGRTVEIESSHIHHIKSRKNAAVNAGGRAILRDTVISASSGARGGAINANGVRLENTTLHNVTAGFNGGGIDTGRGATIVNSTIRDASAGRDGGAVVAEGTVVVRDSQIIDAHSDQDNSLYAYGAHLTIANSTIADADPVSFGKGGVTHGSITVQDSRLVETSKLHAATIRVHNTSVNGSLSLYGQDFTISQSRFEHTGGIDAFTVRVTNSTFSDVPKIQASDKIVVRDSILIEFGGFRSFDDDLHMTLSNVTMYRPGKNVITNSRTRSLDRVTIIEATPPVFSGTLPNKSAVFIDTTNDSEPPFEWDADVFWSRDDPFPAVTRLPLGASSTPSPTPSATLTPTATTPQSSATGSQDSTATAADVAPADGGSDDQFEDQSGPPDPEHPVPFSTILMVAVGCVVFGVVLLLLGAIAA